LEFTASWQTSWSFKKTTGRYVVKIDSKTYATARIIYLHVHGVLHDEIDHIDLDRTNDRIGNLRVATHSQNCMNKRISPLNTSGYKGVRWDKKAGRWYAVIQRDGKRHELGRFTSKELAHEAYQKAAKELHGEFARLE
jgi:hypothetical protein